MDDFSHLAPIKRLDWPQAWDALDRQWLQAEETAIPKPGGLLLALSGGADSTALLALLAGWCRARQVPLKVAHVNHGLQADASAWAEHCRRLATALGLEAFQCQVQVTAQSGDSLEAAARTARYQALFACLAQCASASEMPQSPWWLVTAHHADDQLETFLLQALRGAGVQGLSGLQRLGLMRLHAASESPMQAWVWRPLLDLSWVCTHRDLLDFCQRQRWPYLADPMNEDPRWARVYLRQRVMPELRALSPSVAGIVARSAAWCHDAALAQQALAHQDLAALQVGEQLRVDALLALPPFRQRAALRAWLQVRWPASRLTMILQQVSSAASDRVPCVGDLTWQVFRWRGLLWQSPVIASWPTSELRFSDDATATSVVQGDAGILRLIYLNDDEPTPGLAGVAADCVSQDAGQLQALRGRARLRRTPGQPSRQLKQWVQAADDLPPWRRETLPCWVIPSPDGADKIALWAATLGYHADFVRHSGPRWHLAWTPSLPATPTEHQFDDALWPDNGI